MTWLLLSLFGLVLTVIQILLSPLLALWKVRLPWCLSWFQTQDNPLMGDSGHYERWAWLYLKAPLWLAAYVQRLAWLLRNPTDGFDTKFGAVFRKDTDILTVWGNPKTSNRPLESGWCYAELYNGKHYWMLYVVYRWPYTNRCLRIYLGWKLMGAVHGEPGRYPMVFVPNPFSKFST